MQSWLRPVKEGHVASGALEQSALVEKDREQLVAIATALGVKSAARAKKADLVDMILEQTKPVNPEPKVAAVAPVTSAEALPAQGQWRSARRVGNRTGRA